jgi:hypothetical protein
MTRHEEERAMRARHAAAICAVAAGLSLGATVTAAGADPTGARNAFSGTADCGSAGSYTFVVNSANGQGSGTQNGNQAVFAPAHLNPGNGVFHPTAFDLTFTLTPASGPSQSFTNTASRPNKVGDTTCHISGSQTDPAGDTFSLSGSVVGWVS